MGVFSDESMPPLCPRADRPTTATVQAEVAHQGINRALPVYSPPFCAWLAITRPISTCASAVVARLPGASLGPSGGLPPTGGVPRSSLMRFLLTLAALLGMTAATTRAADAGPFRYRGYYITLMRMP